MTNLPIYPLGTEHKMIRDAARDFARKEITPIAAEFDESGEFPHATVRKMGDLGFMGIEVAEQYGGADMDTLAYVLALEEISKVDASHGVIIGKQFLILSRYIEIWNRGTEEKFYHTDRIRFGCWRIFPDRAAKRVRCGHNEKPRQT
jgi:alkylation response protein AidB-like acyl-CoA dehydrogenase